MNPIVNLISLRDELNSRAGATMEVINMLTNTDTPATSFTWPMQDGRYVTYTHQLDQLSIYGKDGQMLGMTRPRTYLENNPDMLALPLYSGADVCVNDILQQMTDSMNVSSYLTAIAQQMCCRGGINVTELDGITSENVTMMTDDILRINSVLRLSADTSGKISAFSFLNAIKDIASYAEDTVDDDHTWELDRSSPFAIRSFVTNVISTVITAIGAVLVAVGNAVAAVIGLVAIAISKLIAAVQTHVSDYLTVNYTEATDYVRGPNLFTPSAPLRYDSERFVQNGTLTLHETINGDVYTWSNGDGTSSVNCFLRPIFNPSIVAGIVKACTMDITAQGTGFSWEKIDQPDMSDIALARLDEADWLKIMIDPVLVAKTLYLDQCFRDFLSLSVNSKFEESVLATPPHQWNLDDKSTILHAMWLVTAAQADALDYAHLPDDVNIIQSMYTGIWSKWTGDGLNNWKLINFFSPTSTVENQAVYHDAQALSYFDGSVLLDPWRLCFTLTGTNDLDCGVTYDQSCVGHFSSRNVDFIPQARAIIIPDFTPKEIITTAVLTAILVTGITIIGGVVARRLAVMKSLKQTNRLTQLNTLRQQYLDNPTEANAQAWKKAMLKYNMRAALLGWGSYDASNGWMNASSVGGAAILSSMDTSSLYGKIADTSTTTDSKVDGTISAIQGVEAKVSQVKQLINGTT